MNGKASEITVDYLLDLLTKLHDNGNGDMKIRCSDGFIHEDEIGINHIDNEIMFRGALFNFPIAEKIGAFKKDIDAAYRRFYRADK